MWIKVIRCNQNWEDYFWEPWVNLILFFGLFLEWKMIVNFFGGKNTRAVCFLGCVLCSNFKALKCFPYFLITQVQNWLCCSASLRFIPQEPSMSFRERFHLESRCPELEGTSCYSGNKQFNCSTIPQGLGVLENHWWPNSMTAKFTCCNHTEIKYNLPFKKENKSVSFKPNLQKVRC